LFEGFINSSSLEITTPQILIPSKQNFFPWFEIKQSMCFLVSFDFSSLKSHFDVIRFLKHVYEFDSEFFIADHIFLFPM